MLALAWVPFAVVAHSVEGNASVLRVLVAAVMFLSFAHQPLTMPLVYASPWRRQSHRRMFRWAPPVALALVLVATQVDLAMVAVVGALWNAEHTLMQRYGITRIYGRRVGDDNGRVERWMLVGWLCVPLLLVAAQGRLGPLIDRLGISSVDSTAAGILARLPAQARLALVPVAAATLLVTARWVRAEFRAGSPANPGKRLYVAATAALFATALFDPISAVVGFVGSHSVEYFVIVDRSVVSEATHPGPLGRLARLRAGRAIFWGGYAVAVTALFFLLYRLAPPRLLLESVLVIGALHFLYDSFIWKLRKPEVSASLAPRPALRAMAASS